MNFPLFKQICETPGAPGHEYRIRNLIENVVKDHVDEYWTDAMGNLIMLKKGKSDKKVLVAAHMDEIALIITHIDEDGFARFHTLGGFDPKTFTAQRVIAHGKKEVIGVLGSKPIHIMTAEERKKVAKKEDYFIDFGMPAKQVKELVAVGDVVTRERELIEMGNCVNGKSIDNRVCVYTLVEALKQLEKPACDVYAVFSVQEEVGLRGAWVAAHQINPDFGIGLDTTIAYDLPGAQDYEKIAELGRGVAIKIMDSAVISDPRMVKFMRKIAEKEALNWQNEILPAGGTDTGALQRGGKLGAIAGCISIPTRYLHSVIEMANKDDISAAISLLKHSLEQLDSFDYNW